MMQDDMRKALLPNKGTSFQKLYDQSLSKIQRIKQRNDFMQKQIGNQFDDQLKKQIKNQIKFVQNQIKQLKTIMDIIEQYHKDPQSRNKLKNIKGEAEKQIQRNKILLKEIVNKSFTKGSKGQLTQNDEEQQNKYIQGGQINYQQLNNNNNHHQGNQGDKNSLISQNHDNYFIEHQEIDLQVQRKIMQQKNNILKQVQQTTMKVNQMITDTAHMVNEQGQHLNIIDENLFNTYQNVQQTNKQLVSATALQKKSRKKYIIFVAIIILIVVIVVGVVLIIELRKDK